MRFSFKRRLHVLFSYLTSFNSTLWRFALFIDWWCAFSAWLQLRILSILHLLHLLFHHLHWLCRLDHRYRLMSSFLIDVLSTVAGYCLRYYLLRGRRHSRLAYSDVALNGCFKWHSDCHYSEAKRFYHTLRTSSGPRVFLADLYSSMEKGLIDPKL